MSNWFLSTEEIETLVTKDGLTLKNDLDYRNSSCGFIQEVGIELKIPQLTIATACVYFHRFYLLHPFKSQEFDRFVI